MTDIQRRELMAMAARAISDAGGPEIAYVHFKFTCDRCGARCVLAEPNTFRERGECPSCGHVQPISAGGFMLVVRTDPTPRLPIN